MARTARAGAVAAPRPVRRPRPRVAPPRAVPQAVRARGESLLDALLGGRAWIALVGLLLVGIVFFNVDLLRLNRSIAVTSEQSETISRENASLRRELARLGSSERVQRAALQRGLVLPPPGQVRYRNAKSGDAKRALANIKPPGQVEVAQPAASSPPAASQQVTTPEPATTPPATTPSATTPTATTPPVAAPQPAAPPAPTAATPPAATPGTG